MTTPITSIFTSTDAKVDAKAPKNRILGNFRVTLGGDKEATHFFASMERRLILKGDRDFFTSAERAHAERVLSKLVALTA